jgi:hypothetical protein
MTFLLLLPAALSAVLLGAHFLRFGQYLFVLLALALLPLLWVKRPWAARVVQGVLLLGTVIWVHTTLNLLSARRLLGEPYLRMVIILAAVAAFTLLSAVLFQTRRLQMRFGLRQ